MRRTATIALLMLCARLGEAQTTSYWSQVWKETQIRQNTNVKRDIAKPAFVTFTLPKDGPNSYQVGLGVLSPVVSRSLFSLATLLDYQRNTALDQEQNVFKAGVSGEWQWQAMGNNRPHNSGLLTFRQDFKNDAVKKTRGSQSAIGYTHLFEGSRGFPHPNEDFPIGEALDLIYFPYAGLEVDHTATAPTKAGEGTVVRAVGQISLALYPASRQLRRRLEFLSAYTYRSDLHDSTDEADARHPLFTFEANVFPLKTARGDVGFGASYERGEDPDAGFAHQQYWQFTIKVRLK